MVAPAAPQTPPETVAPAASQTPSVTPAAPAPVQTPSNVVAPVVSAAPPQTPSTPVLSPAPAQTPSTAAAAAAPAVSDATEPSVQTSSASLPAPAVSPRGWLGISLAEGDGTAGGVRVAQVYRGHPADVAGLKAADRITRIGATDIASVPEAAVLIGQLAAGATVEFTVVRGDAPAVVVAVTLGERPSEGAL